MQARKFQIQTLFTQWVLQCHHFYRNCKRKKNMEVRKSLRIWLFFFIFFLSFWKKRTMILTVTHYVISVRIRSIFGSHFPIFGPEKLRMRILELNSRNTAVFSEVFLGPCQTFLTHLLPMYPFPNPWKHQKTVRFYDVFRGRERVHLKQMG